MRVWSDRFEAYGNGRKAPLGGLSDTALLALLQRYRRDVAKRYRVVESSALAEFASGNLWISAKLDGELWFLVKRGDDVALCTYNGRVLHGTSLLDEARAALGHVGDVVVAGELVARAGEGRSRVGHVGRAWGDASLEPTLSFHPFDLVEHGGAHGGAIPYGERWGHLHGWFANGSRVVPVTTVAGTSQEALAYYREWVGTQTFEGVVVRTEQGITYKVKPTFTLDGVIVAVGARVVDGRPEMREVTVALRRDDGSLQIVGPVGNGFTREQRVAWLARLAAIEAPSGFRMANRDGTLCRFVRPEIVVEIQCSDLLEHDTDDEPIARMALTYDPTTGYAARGDMRTAAMLFPVFVRERTDKTPDVASIGLTQITSRLPIDLDGDVTVRADDPQVTVIERRAWTKGATAVRKYVMLETQGAGASGVAPFLTYFTDFSADRAEPLKTSLRSAATGEIARSQVQAWVDDNVKRGWVEAGGAPSVVSGEAAPVAPKKTKAPKG